MQYIMYNLWFIFVYMRLKAVVVKPHRTWPLHSYIFSVVP